MTRITVLIVSIAIFLTGCSFDKKSVVYDDISDFDGKAIAAMNGAVFNKIVGEVLPNATFSAYNSFNAQVAALLAGKVTAISFDYPTAKYAVSLHPELAIFDYKINADNYGYITKKNSPLSVAVTEQINVLREKGVLDELATKWFDSPNSSRVISMPNHKKSTFDGSAGTIRYGCDNATPPMSYVGDGSVSLGYEIELMMRVAYELNMNLEITSMDFYRLFPSLDDDKFDIIGGCISLTEERCEKYDATTPSYEGSIVLVYKK